MSKYELLAPAGDLEKLKVALIYGADACFIGGKEFSLRAKAGNFSHADLIEAVVFAHNLNKKIYVTVNIIPNSEEIKNAKEYLLFLDSIHVDAVIVTSPTLISFIQEKKLNLEIHISTQASVSNSYALEFYKSLGAKRIVLARELSLENIKKIKEKTNIEIEVFIHGGLCSSISGRCHLSSFYVGRDANKGACAHSCRWNYTLDDKQKFLFGSRDLCVLPFFYKLLSLNVASFKIEGRMKSLHYIATVVRAYRYYIDNFENGSLSQDVLDYCYEELSRCESRNYSTNFFKGYITPSDMVEINENTANSEFKGYLKNENGKTYLYPKNLVKVNEVYEMISPGIKDCLYIKVLRLILDGKDENDTRYVKDKIEIILDHNVLDYAILRKSKDNKK